MAMCCLSLSILVRMIRRVPRRNYQEDVDTTHPFITAFKHSVCLLSFNVMFLFCEFCFDFEH